jgi:hypothetical protein
MADPNHLKFPLTVYSTDQDWRMHTRSLNTYVHQIDISLTYFFARRNYVGMPMTLSINTYIRALLHLRFHS